MHLFSRPTSLRRCMSRLAVCAAIGFATLCAICPQRAQAEFFQFSTTLTINAGTMLPATANLGMTNGTSLVTMTTEIGQSMVQFVMDPSAPPENIDASGEGTDIVFTFISASVLRTANLTTVKIPFDFALKIDNYTTDLGGVSNGSGTFHITGEINGSVGAGKKVNLTTISYTSPAEQFAIIGGEQYKLSMAFYTPPGPFNAGALGVHVTAVPEPGTLGLLGIAAVGLVAPAVRRRRRAAG